MTTDLSFESEVELSEQELLFNAFVDDELSTDERAAFMERLESDPEFRSAWDDFSFVIESMQKLPFQFAPDDFVHQVQSRIRTRSRGRFFAEELLFRSRVPYEVVALVMIIVMAAAYLFMEAPPDKQMRDVNVPERLRSAP